ncbi:MAG: hypothetical protein CVU39_18075 [Chloroflexi bacterium HGW-Chloroflexi-10]|nr:MAG: hypothetical protein CVU39_18075 [Chloroflexi bacterium HGW-Chloroflexi-10]
MNGDTYSNFPYPVWSPNGMQIVFPANFNSENGEFEVVLLDLQTQDAYHVSQNQLPVGWMKE